MKILNTTHRKIRRSASLACSHGIKRIGSTVVLVAITVKFNIYYVLSSEIGYEQFNLWYATDSNELAGGKTYQP